jgi:hypothetical protein
MSEALRWALESSSDPARAAADWLARDISPQHDSAWSLMADPSVSLESLHEAKTAFKTMCIVGETVVDRRHAARLYAAAIAAARVRHGESISTQSQSATRRAWESLEQDPEVPATARAMIGLALCMMNNEAPADER